MANFYPDTNLRDVRYATGIDTVHGQNITIGNEIFFTTDMDFDSRNDLKTLFHELEHVDQYARRGGVRAFLAEYIFKIPGKVIQKRSFNVHDDLDIERAAISKSEEVVRSYYGWDFFITNNCSHPVSLAVRYRNSDGDWATEGYWSIRPSQRTYLASDGAKIRTKNALFYYYAETTDDSGLVWQGDHTVSANDGRELKMKTLDQSANAAGAMTINLSCQP